jgi:hypothetical protein
MSVHPLPRIVYKIVAHIEKGLSEYLISSTTWETPEINLSLANLNSQEMIL